MAKEKDETMEEFKQRMIKLAYRMMDDVENRKHQNPVEHVHAIVEIFDAINRTEKKG